MFSIFSKVTCAPDDGKQYTMEELFPPKPNILDRKEYKKLTFSERIRVRGVVKKMKDPTDNLEFLNLIQINGYYEMSLEASQRMLKLVENYQ